MDIASAPRDGTWILALDIDMGVAAVPRACHWRGGGLKDWHGYPVIMTHWQPLPPPPKRKVKKTVEAWAVVGKSTGLHSLQYTERCACRVSHRLAEGRFPSDCIQTEVIKLTGEYEVEE
jgi:hypothetical protein